MRKLSRRDIVLLLALAVIAAATYSNTLANGFSFDDNVLFVKNTAVHGLGISNLKAIFTTMHNGMEYLPVRDITYGLDYMIWGLDPSGWHTSNLVYYIIACCLFYLFTYRLAAWSGFGSPHLAAFAAASLFVVHPVHVESVASLSHRKDLLSGIFLLLSMHAYLRYMVEGGARRYTASFIYFVLAVFSKPTAVVLPLALTALEWFFPERRGRGRLGRWAALVPFYHGALMYAIITLKFVYGPEGITDESFVLAGAYEQRVYTVFPTVFEYIRLMLVPKNLTISHAVYARDSLLELDVLLPAIIILAAVPAMIIYGRRRPSYAFASAWFLAGLVPVVGLVPGSTTVAERYLFIPSMGFCMVFGLIAAAAPGYLLKAGRRSGMWQSFGLYSTLRWRPLRAALAVTRTEEREGVPASRVLMASMVALVVVSLSMISYQRNFDWKDNIALLMSEIKMQPGDPRMHWLAGKVLFKAGMYEQAFGQLDEARRINSNFGVDYLVFEALLALENGSPEGAIEMLDTLALPEGAEVVEVNYIYGIAYDMLGEHERALMSMERAVAGNIWLRVMDKRVVEQALHSMASAG